MIFFVGDYQVEVPWTAWTTVGRGIQASDRQVQVTAG